MTEVQKLRGEDANLSLKDKIYNYLHQYSYLETVILVSTYLLIGYLVNPEDICLFNTEVPFLLILLALITLFHGFENGILAITMVSFSMLYFYESFPYVEFLISLMMTLIYSEFHYYWTQKIKHAKMDADYKNVKLNELSKAFFSLKISHDQLEKNYVIKPMSIRNALNTIINTNKNIQYNKNIAHKQEQNYKKFLELLQKSFNMSSGLILHRVIDNDKYFSQEVVDVIYGEYTEEVEKEEIFNNYLVDKAIARKEAVYISDDSGEPSLKNELETKFIAAIPALYNEEIVSVLVIEKMPFMAFERENLTSIAILLEFFSIEMRKKEIVQYDKNVDFIENNEYKFEVSRLSLLYKKYKVDSVLLVLKINSELQAIRMNEKISKMLRSLDMNILISRGDYFYISLLFPLHDQAATEGFLNRLTFQLDEKDRAFDHMSFYVSRLDLYYQYIHEETQEEKA